MLGFGQRLCGLTVGVTTSSVSPLFGLLELVLGINSKEKFI